MEKNFEKEVKQRLEEMKLSPAPMVWDNVELAIRKKKQKTRLLWWLFFFAFLGLGFISFLLFPDLSKRPYTDKGNSAHVKTNVPLQRTVTPKNTISLPAVDEVHQETRLPKLSSEKKTILIPVSDEVIIPEGKISKTLNREINKVLKEKRTAIDNFSYNTEKIVSAKEVDVINKEEVGIQLSDTAIMVAVNNDSIAKTEIIALKKQTDTAVNTDSTKRKAVKKFASKFKVGFSVELGTASIRGRSRSGIELDLLPNPIVTKPSEITKGSYFSPGLSVTKNLNTQISISTGLNYAFYSTHMHVGQKINADTVLQRANSLFATNAYYLNDNSIRYTNKFHALRLPVIFNFKPFLSYPLYIHAGLELQKVFSTNALAYNKNSNLYYADSRAFSKIQIFSNLGLSYTIFKGKNLDLRIGTKLHYGHSKINFKENDSNKMFLFGLGIELLRIK